MNKIDFVVTWVDSSDEAWRLRKEKFSGESGKNNETGAWAVDSRDERYRDLDIFRYFFRSIEANAPWVNRIFLVTDDQVPDFLDTKHPKLRLVSHKEIIPETYLPTFNSNAIEMFLHRIPGLSETFVYFNDDIFLNTPVKPKDFFVEGKPVDMFAFQPVVANPANPVMSHILQNDALVIARHFDKRAYVLHNPGKVFKPGYPVKYFVYNALELCFPKFTGFYDVHCHMNLLRSTFETLWELEPEILGNTASHKFRNREDVTIYLMRDYQKMTGNFYPVNLEKESGYYDVSDDNRRVCADIRRHIHRYICINDTGKNYSVKRASKQLQRAFEAAYPHKSSYEK